MEAEELSHWIEKSIIPDNDINEKLSIEILLMLLYFSKTTLSKIDLKSMDFDVLQELSSKIDNEESRHWINNFSVTFNQIWERWVKDIWEIQIELYKKD